MCVRAKLAGVTVNVLRHSFAATAAEMGFSELTIAGLLGHSVPGVTARYAHVPDRALLAAADQVSARITAALAGESGAEVLDIGQQRRSAAAPRARKWLAPDPVQGTIPVLRSLLGRSVVSSG
jgi:hypothetical protein